MLSTQRQTRYQQRSPLRFGDGISELIYLDKLVEIVKDSILFRGNYYPFGPERVAFSEVDGVVAKEPEAPSRDRN